MNIAATVTELGQVLAAVGLNVYATVPDNGEFPAVVVQPPTVIDYSETYAGLVSLTLPLAIFVSASDLSSSWELLYRLLSTQNTGTSIPDTLYNYQNNVNWKRLTILNAEGFTPAGDNAITATLNIKLQG